MTIGIVDDEDVKYRGRKKGIVCIRCKTSKTFTDPITKKETWRRQTINNIWTGDYYCDSCYHKLKRKCRNKELEKDSKSGKGFRIEQVIAKTLGIKSCSIESDNFNSAFDLYDPIKYKEIQARSAKPSIRKATWNDKVYEYHVWHFALDLPEFDTIIVICMSEDYKNIERMYAIPVDKLPMAQGLTIYKDPKNRPWYEEYRIDEKPYNDTYHSMSIDNCEVIKNDKCKDE